ncbi:MAG TPA: hypothetical protein VIV11_16530 [Kofleriaceae bacterium]
MANRVGWVVIAIVVMLGCKQSAPTGAPAGSAAAGSAAAGSQAAAGSSAAAPAGSAAADPWGAGGSAAGAAAAPAGSATTESAVAAAVGSAATATAPAPTGFKVGDAVTAQWTNGSWYPGKIGKINDDGTYRVNFNDGDVSPALPLKKIKARKAVAGGGGSKGGATASKGGAEPCPASHWTRCGGNCYLLTDDRYNCGRCGNVCPSNMSLCRNGRCDCTGIEKDNNGGVCPP